MPNLNLVPDFYFMEGNNNYAVFLLWVKATRLRLLSLNQYRPGNYADAHAAESARNFLETKSITDVNIIKSKYEKGLQDEKTIFFNEKTAKNSTEIEKYNKSSQSKLQSELLDVLDKPVADRLKDRAIAEKIIADEQASTIFETIGDGDNPIPLDQRSKTKLNEIPDYLKPAVTTFPLAGESVTKSITDNILNPSRTKYTFFSGSKKVTEQRYWVKQINGVDTQSSKPGNIVKPLKVDGTKFIGRPGAESSDYSKEILKNTSIITPTGTYKFFIEKLHGRHYTSGAAEPYAINPVTNQKGVYKDGGVNYSNRKVFAAFIDDYNDSYSVGWEPYNFVGRGEKVYAYSSTERKITMQFTILTDHSVEQLAALDQINQKLKSTNEDDILSYLLNDGNLNWGNGTYDYDSKSRLSGGVSTYFDTPETTWQKVTFLAQCCYPYYRTDGKMKEQPMVRMRIGDFYDVICYINSLNYKLNALDVPYIDFNKSALGEQPMGIQVTIDAYVVHDYEPSSEYYGFYHRTQFDNHDAQAAYEAKVWGVGLSKNADSVSKILKKNSPLSVKDVLNTNNLTDLLSTTDFQEIQRDIKVFKDNFKGLGNESTNLFDHVKKIKLKNIFDAIKSIQSQKDFFNALQSTNDKFQASIAQVQAVEDISNKFGVNTKQFENLKATTSDNFSKINDKLNYAEEQEAGISLTTKKIKKITNNIPKTFADIVGVNKTT